MVLYSFLAPVIGPKLLVSMLAACDLYPHFAPKFINYIGGMICIYGSCVISSPAYELYTHVQYMIYMCFSLHLRVQYKIDAEKINRYLALWRHNKIKEIDLTIYCTCIFVYKENAKYLFIFILLLSFD